MATRHCFLCALTLTLLATFAAGQPKSKDTAAVRRTCHEFLNAVCRGAAPAARLPWFTPDAFTNPITRQITVFAGGSSAATAAEIRQYVLQTLAKSAAPKQANASCPDPTATGDILPENLPPDNQPALDRFVLKRLTNEVLAIATADAKGAAHPEPELLWLQDQVQMGRR
jgi:hypothetical protein